MFGATAVYRVSPRTDLERPTDLLFNCSQPTEEDSLQRRDSRP